MVTSAPRKGSRMTPDGNAAGRRQRTRSGAHRVPRKRSALARIVAGGGAVVCIAVAYEVSSPIAEALSIVIPVGDAGGSGNTIQINILEGNIFDPQLGINGGNVSNNSTVGNVAIGNGNGVSSVMSSASPSQMMLGTTAGNGNTIQINILSYNIFNPQLSMTGNNVSNNTTIGNVAMGNGNNSTNKVLSAGDFWTAWVSGMTGNGNTTQMAFFSGNIFNPQWSLVGANVSNNTAITNVAKNNGNKSNHQVLSAGFWGANLFGGLRGNGNTIQIAAVASNIINPQFSFGGGNTSNNTAVTNEASGNGNGSSTDVTSSGPLGNTSVAGSSGNGNTTQIATGSGNINNDQINFGMSPAVLVSTSSTDTTTLLNQLQSSSVSTGSSTISNGTAVGTPQQSSIASTGSSNSTAVGNQQKSSSGSTGSPGSSNSTAVGNQKKSSGFGSLSPGSNNPATPNNSKGAPGSPGDSAGAGGGAGDSSD
jgi:hypothetical protein